MDIGGANTGGINTQVVIMRIAAFFVSVCLSPSVMVLSGRYSLKWMPK